MWLWGTLLGILAVITVVVIVVDRRRGPSDTAGRGLDFTATNRSSAQYDGEIPQGGGGGGGPAG
jgi:hypothetical protein